LPDLVVVDCVTHARINSLGHICAKVPQHPSGLVHAPYRNVAIDVAATNKDRRPSERASVVARRTLGTVSLSC
jgi:hypothetical protein